MIYSSYAELDTLTYWAKGSGVVAYTDNSITMQWAHFYPEAPCYIKRVIVWFYGNSGTANMYIAGQEAGSSVPEVVGSTLKVLWGQNGKSFNASPSTAMANSVDINDIYIDGNQFFVGFTQISPGMFFASDQTAQTPWCTSQDGGTYKYQALFVNDGQQAGWALGDNAFAIDVIVDYPTKTPSYHFRDITEEYDLPTNLNPGTIAFADINDDGYQDLLVRGKLYENKGGQFFEEITSKAGLYGTPAANIFVDNDNDGDMDIIFLNQGVGTKSILFYNNGDGTFGEKELNIPELHAVSCYSIADVNGDFYPDLFIGQLWKTYPEPLPNYFFLNDKNNNFTNNTTILYPQYDGTWNYPNEQWDPANMIVNRNRNSRGSQFVDFDNDGDLDLFVTNYFLQWDEFYKNNGDGSFTDIINQKNIDVNTTGHNHGTGVDWYDYDNDGDMDLLLSQFAHPRFIKDYDHRPLTIYKNNGSPNFTFTDTYDATNFTSTIGLGYEETYAGAAWGDANNDGLADLITTTFYGCRFIDFYQQNNDHTFGNKTFEYGLEGIVTGEDACWVDFDNDGKLDLAMSNNRQFRLFKNFYDLTYDWLQVDLKGKPGQESNIIGARVRVNTNNGVFTQEVSLGRGQKMQKPFRLHFGLGRLAEISKVEVRWPGTTTYEEYFSIQPNKIVKLIQDKGGQPQVPDVPVLAYPLDGTVDFDSKADKLKWNRVDNTDKYQVLVAKDVSFNNIVITSPDLTKPELPVPELDGQTVYYWKVKAGNVVGFSNWSEVWSFTTLKITTTVPGKPILISPADGASGVSRKNGKLSWQTVEGADDYNLQVAENYSFNPLVLDINGLTVTEFPVSDLNGNSTYFWRVRGSNKAGFGEFSTLRNFITDNSQVDYPIPPELLTPAKNTENLVQNAYLTWKTGEGATQYRIQISTHYTVGQDIVVDTVIRPTRFPVGSLEGETEYFWQVYSINSRGESEDASEIWNFTTGIFTNVEDLNITPGSLYITDPTPNPVTNSCSFNIGIPGNSQVSLDVYNINGLLIDKIISKEMAEGTYKINWAPNKLNTGMYYIQLTSGVNTQTKKVAIVK